MFFSREVRYLRQTLFEQAKMEYNRNQ